MKQDLSALSAIDLLTAYGQKTLSPVEVLRDAFQRLERFNPAVNAFTHIDHESAINQARASEARWMRGEPMGMADGILATNKSNLAVTGWPARRGSTTIGTEAMTYDAPVTTALKAAGCILIAQTTMPEFGWIGVTHSKLHGVTRNPWNTSRTPGGSSGGAAVAGTLRIGQFHVGTDAAGSIRIPSAYSGLFGLVPGVGRVPAYPASPFVPLARLGPMTRTVDDGALMLRIMAKPDNRDIMATTEAAPDYSAVLTKGLRGLRIGWSATLGYVDCLDPAIHTACEKVAKSLTQFGAIVEEADPGFAREEAYVPLRIMWAAGCASIMKRIPANQHEQVDAGFRRCAELARTLSAVDLMQAMAERAALYEKMRRFHERYDVLLTPTMPTTAIEAGVDVPPDGRFGSEWFNWSPYTWPFNVTGQPASSVPVGLALDGLPVGLQVVAPIGREDLVLRVSKGIEMLSDFPLLDGVRKGQ